MFALFVQADAPKNVVLLIADDLGNQLSCYGDKVAKTPNIDALAKQGTKFTHGFASVASCSPSRATMLTGQPTHQSGQYGLAHSDHNFASFKKTKSLPAILNAANYKTAVISKNHVQPKEVYPFGEEIAVNGKNVVAIADAAKKFIAGCEGKPFFMHVGYTDPHRAGKGFGNDGKLPDSIPRVEFDPKAVPLPYHLPDQEDVRKDLADYYEAVARLDYGIGLMMKVLKDAKVLDNTLIIFLSDNGIPFPGAKTTLYDTGVRLPLIVLKPGQKAGCSNDMLVSWTDLAPTILEWCGLSKPDAMTGNSFLKFIDDEAREGWTTVYGSHQFHEVTMYYPMRMIRTAKHKYIVNLAHQLDVPHASDLWGSPTWQGMLKRGDFMLGERSVKAFKNRPREELYDVVNDGNELKNLADDTEFADLKAQLKKKLADWRKATNDPWLIKDKHE
jgi:N-sulfoglucosamine sulfohydrolase